MIRILAFLAAVALFGCVFGTQASFAAENKQSVEVQKPLANIYEYLDPKSTIIRQARKGELYELVFAGTSWYQVRVKDRVGWLERRAGEVIDSPGARILGLPASIFAIAAVLIVATLAGVALLVFRQMRSDAETV